jgi:F420-non-reducing hydrogenase iron-sulfur subunit
LPVKSEQPNIVCFMCNWAFCQDELKAPRNLNVVRVMCVGGVDPDMILNMFVNGADAVMLAGCKKPDCHFVEGNVQAERTVKMLRELLALADLEQQRLRLLWVSPIEQRSFRQYAEDFSEEMRILGPSFPENEKTRSDLMTNILAARNAASDFPLRVLLGREKELTEVMDAYGDKVPQEDFDAVLKGVVASEFMRHKILLLTKSKPLSVKTLAESVGMKPADVLGHIVDMRRKGLIALDHIEKNTPLYKALEVK